MFKPICSGNYTFISCEWPHHTKEMKWHYKEQVNTFIYSFRIQLSTRWISSWLISEMPSGPFSSVPRRHDFRSWLRDFWTFTRTVRQLPNSFHNIKMLIVLYIYGPSFLFQKTRRRTTFERHWKRKPATILAVCRKEKKQIGDELVDTDMNLKKGNTHNILDNRTFSFISTTV